MLLKVCCLGLVAGTSLIVWKSFTQRGGFASREESEQRITELVRTTAQDCQGDRCLATAMKSVIALSERENAPMDEPGARLISLLGDERGHSLSPVRDLADRLQKAPDHASVEKAAADFLRSAGERGRDEAFESLAIALEKTRGEHEFAPQRLVFLSLADQLSPSNGRASDLLMREMAEIIDRAEAGGPTDTRTFSELLHRIIRRADGAETAIRDGQDLFRRTSSPELRNMVREELSQAYALESRTVEYATE